MPLACGSEFDLDQVFQIRLFIRTWERETTEYRIVFLLKCSESKCNPNQGLGAAKAAKRHPPVILNFMVGGWHLP